MATKGKRNDTLASTPEEVSGTSGDFHSQKKQKKDTPAICEDFTIAEIRAFNASITAIKDWTSTTVAKKHVQVIYWFDVEHLSKEECAKRYPNKESKPCSMTNIFKVYNNYVPRFYAEKGLRFIPLRERGPVRASLGGKKKKRKQVKKSKRNPLDIRLEELFGRLPDLALRSPQPQSKDDATAPCPHHGDRNDTEHFNAADPDAVTFLCKLNSTTYGPASGIQLSRTLVHRHCCTLRDTLISNPRINTITHGPEISADTVCRFSACITPTLARRLPDFVTTGYGAFEQEWSTDELEDLYVLAVTLGAGGVCDLVIDRWIEDLRRSEARVVVDEFEEARYFDVLGFGPELLNFLWVNDEKGFRFFSTVLVSQGMRGFDRIREMHLANWHEGVKKGLITAMEEGNPIYTLASPGTDRQRSYRTSHFSARLLYANSKFNAHHDSEEVCRSKLKMCRERAGMFVGRVSDADVESVVFEQERWSQEGEADREMEDESEEEFDHV
ncbi:hypothetical protein N0V86_006629 [Didymella sp. IMI 355093]|nr:hypothetical protein N0V86_006629 [Didymella sp. IMI 355093]